MICNCSTSAKVGLDSNYVFSAIEPLVESGFAIHWLRENSKAPADIAWSNAPVATVGQLRSTQLECVPISGNRLSDRVIL
ncbi:MAG: hypothetical protein CGW95_12885 [Phenylobacterium zucineum]|nr:MAG: hypothetical protein CGW95_12885 [Phenylobacterium zucineum]